MERPLKINSLMKYIKSINEDFGGESGAFGDTYGYGGANGVLKINYKPFSDLSVSVGTDPNMKTDVKGSEYKIGDVVIAEPLDSKSKVTGVIVRSFRKPDNIEFRYFIQVYNKGKKTERVIEVKSDSIKFAEGGEHGNMATVTKYKNSEIADKSYNSKTVYNSSELGLETTGG
jgi:hypothetical protein